MLYHVDIQGYIVWYKNKPDEANNIKNRLNGYIFSYNTEFTKMKIRLAQPFQAYNEVADIIEKDYPQEYDASGKPIYSTRQQCIVSGTMIPIKCYDKKKKRYAVQPTLRIDRIYHFFNTHDDLVEFTGNDRADEGKAQFEAYIKDVSEDLTEEDLENQEFDLV